MDCTVPQEACYYGDEENYADACEEREVSVGGVVEETAGCYGVYYYPLRPVSSITEICEMD
jgi:hypothetical protein